MTKQLSLGFESNPTIETTVKNIENKVFQGRNLPKDKYTFEYLIEKIVSDFYLWDLRTWNNYKDRNEVLAWLKEDPISSKNCGHVTFCIALLREKMTPEDILPYVMGNKHIAYPKCKVKCFGDITACPYPGENFSEKQCKKNCE